MVVLSSFTKDLEKPDAELAEKAEAFNQNSRHNPAGLSEDDLAFLESFPEEKRKKVLRKVSSPLIPMSQPVLMLGVRLDRSIGGLSLSSPYST